MLDEKSQFRDRDVRGQLKERRKQLHKGGNYTDIVSLLHLACG